MEFVAVGALSLVVAFVYLFVQPKVFGLSQTKSLQGNYVGNVVLTGAAIFVAILAAGWIFSFLGKRVTV